MSYQVDNDEYTTQQPQPGAPGIDSGSVSLSGGSGGMATGGAGGTAAAPASGGAPSAAKPSTPGGWANLNNYLDANKDQGAAMGSQVAGSLNNEAQSAAGAITNDQNNFNTQVGQSGASLATDQSKIDQTLANPTKATDADVASFQNDLNGQYAGPKSIADSSDWSDVAGKAQKASSDLGNTQSEAGREQLLQNQYSRGDYGVGSGMNRLDNLLVSGNADAQKAIQGVNSQWSGINDTLNNAVTQSNQVASQRSADTLAANAYAKSHLDTANTGLQTAVNSQLDAAKAKSAQDYQAAVHNLRNNTAVDGTIDTGTATYGLDPSTYLRQGAGPTAQQAATSDQYAQAAALAKLGGQTDSSLLPSSAASQAGSYKPFSFDKDAFQTAVNQRKTNLDNAHTPEVQQAQALLDQRQSLADMLKNGGSQEGIDKLGAQLYGGGWGAHTGIGQGELDPAMEAAYAQQGVADQTNILHTTGKDYFDLMNQYNPSATFGNAAPIADTAQAFPGINATLAAAKNNGAPVR